MKINNDNIDGNNKRVDHNYKVGDKFMLTNNATYKYEMPCNGPSVITMCCTNSTVVLKGDGIKIRHYIRHIKPYSFDTNVEDINIEKYVCR